MSLSQCKTVKTNGYIYTPPPLFQFYFLAGKTNLPLYFIQNCLFVLWVVYKIFLGLFHPIRPFFYLSFSDNVFWFAQQQNHEYKHYFQSFPFLWSSIWHNNPHFSYASCQNPSEIQGCVHILAHLHRFPFFHLQASKSLQ